MSCLSITFAFIPLAACFLIFITSFVSTQIFRQWHVQLGQRNTHSKVKSTPGKVVCDIKNCFNRNPFQSQSPQQCNDLPEQGCQGASVFAVVLVQTKQFLESKYHICFCCNIVMVGLTHCPSQSSYNEGCRYAKRKIVTPNWKGILFGFISSKSSESKLSLWLCTYLKIKFS